MHALVEHEGSLVMKPTSEMRSRLIVVGGCTASFGGFFFLLLAAALAICWHFGIVSGRWPLLSFGVAGLCVCVGLPLVYVGGYRLKS